MFQENKGDFFNLPGFGSNPEPFGLSFIFSHSSTEPGQFPQSVTIISDLSQYFHDLKDTWNLFRFSKTLSQVKPSLFCQILDFPPEGSCANIF